MKSAGVGEQGTQPEAPSRRGGLGARLRNFTAELRRRRVFGFTAAYVVTAWVGIEVASVVLPAFEAPRYVLQALIIGAVALAPAAMVLAWFYDLTRHGLVYTDEQDWRTAGSGPSRADAARVADSPAASAPVASAGECAGQPPPSPEPAELPSPGLAERRLVTVLQCSVAPVDDDEEEGQDERLRAAIPALVTRFDEIVREVEGYLLPTEGELFTTFFGVKTAHEDDALRAVLAAQRMLLHVAALNGHRESEPGPSRHESAAASPALRLRISAGVHTGHAIVEELPGRPVEYWVSSVGQTQNAATALQLGAADGEIRLSRETRSLLHERVPCEPAGEQALPGSHSPVPVYRVSGGTVDTTPVSDEEMIGRDRELSLLAERWDAAADAGGSVVVVRGEPGMGKTRLVARFRHDVEAQAGASVVAFQCAAYFAHSPLHPVLRYVAQRMGCAAGDETAQLTEPQVAHWLSAQGLANPELPQIFREALAREIRPGESLLEPGKRKEMLLQTLLQLVCREADARPTLLLVEDVQWADPTTLELLDLVAAQVPAQRAMLLVTARPGFRARWAEHSDALQISLNRLTPSQSRALVAAVDHARAIDPALVDAIAAKADGVPLFLEELARSVLEQLSGHPGGSTATAPLAVPDTLQASLAARIQRLGPAKAVLQVASTIGRESSLALLRASAGGDAARLDGLLDQLVERELLHRRGVGTQASFVFRHALIQDAAYASMLKSRREECHLQVAHAMEANPAGDASHNAELIAWHYGAAAPSVERQRKSIQHWLAATELALRRSANLEADHFLGSALQQVRRLPEGHERDTFELRVQVLWIPVLVALHGYSSERMAQLSRRALALCESVSDFDLRFMALFGVCVFDMVGGRHEDSHRTALKLSRLDAENGANLRVESEMLLGLTHFFLGRLAPAEHHLRASVAAYDREAHGTHAFTFGQDPEIVAASYLSWVLFCRGDDAQRVANEARTLVQARSLGHPNSLGFALAWAGWSRIFADDHEGLAQIASELGELAAQHGLNSFVVQATVLDALRRARAGDPAGALPGLEAGIDAWQGIGSRCFQMCWDAQLARVCVSAGQLERAGAVLERAATAMAATQERWSECDLHRSRAELERARGNRGAALDCLQQAFDAAARDGAWGWNLAAACDRVELIRDDDPERARQLLDEALGRVVQPAAGSWAKRAASLRESLATQ